MDHLKPFPCPLAIVTTAIILGPGDIDARTFIQDKAMAIITNLKKEKPGGSNV